MTPSLLATYYLLRPLIPRSLQLAVRRTVARRVYVQERAWWPVPALRRATSLLASPWPEPARFAFAIRHDVETSAGLSKCESLKAIDIEMGIRSSFNFCPERYRVPNELREGLASDGFEVGLHGLRHDGLLYMNKRIFRRRAKRMRRYLAEWSASGFYSPSSHHRLDWLHDLPIEYDSSTFDTDPFEPENDGIGLVSPFIVNGNDDGHSYVELPYTMPQDFTLFVMLELSSIDLWKRKLDWIAESGGLAFVVVHPDYLQFGGADDPRFGYPIERYRELVEYVHSAYGRSCWHATPREIAQYWSSQTYGSGDSGGETRATETA